jgi:hypothetical protein
MEAFDRGAAAVILRAASGQLENRCGDPLGSAAALAKGARLVPRPNAVAANATVNTGFATCKRDAYTGAALSARGGSRSWDDR